MISAMLALLLAAPGLLTETEAPELPALSAILTTDSGEVLFEREADRMLPMASTTKLMTALVTLERCGLDEEVAILPAYCAVEGSSMYLRPGERYTVRELLTGLLLASGNDAALALAAHCAGDVGSFCALMNEKAAGLGMRDSHFTNPHGLNEAGHYSTARDLARLMSAALQNETIAALLAMPSAVVGGQALINHNKLLGRCPGCLGGKTGYTKVAGRCLVSGCERADTRLICVTLNDPDDWNSHEKLYDWGFSQVKSWRFSAENTRFAIPLLAGETETVCAVPDGEYTLLLRADTAPEQRLRLPFYVFAPVKAGAEAGCLELWEGERLLLEIPLVYEEDYVVKHG